ncbi:hypothetical protein FDP41_006367 [Naegleria fowleri]|uniref:Methyltransferase small domain-containing protein n=1 Tax=Naegleria fowleri TaxID=5763 RepID=A0A6A5BL33_NAEFO|nr:uncharacterized protein FDP41_006367 [Naegleria fowleri]KAF0974335.1 hypothetical protein FDP41_006367 [Naegleria fowleri]CAG4710557.1 unnamed protein product [Naegleria fowleri]
MPKSANDPDMSHMRSSDFKLVYEFNDDTYLLVDALEKDYIHSHLLKTLTGKENSPQLKFCLEIGCGSGYVTTFVYKLLNSCYEKFLKSSGVSFCLLCTDINPNAAAMTWKTFERNMKQSPKFIPSLFDVVLCDFASAFEKRLKNKIDLLIFNPPYVPCEKDEMGFSDVRAAYAGGENGREVIDRFLPMVKNILSPNGVFYFVLIEDNNPQEIMKLMSQEEYGSFQSSVVLKKRVQGEHLYIVKFEGSTRK